MFFDEILYCQIQILILITPCGFSFHIFNNSKDCSKFYALYCRGDIALLFFLYFIVTH